MADQLTEDALKRIATDLIDYDNLITPELPKISPKIKAHRRKRGKIAKMARRRNQKR